MIDFLNSFKSLIKLEKIHTDSHIFKLHYKFTVILLIVFSILLTSKQYFGDPIKCDVKENRDIIETYCWITGTFTLLHSQNAKSDIVGLGNYANMNSSAHIFVQKYYQWVCIVYCFQALLFYVPRYLWKSWECGRMRLLVKDLGGPLIPGCWNSGNKDRLVSYFLLGNYSHNVYAIRFAMCELLNLINVISQIFLMDWFLTGHFTSYGLSVVYALYAPADSLTNPMTQIFPKVTKCSYRNYGPSGSEQIKDALCILPLNVVNEKLFLFLWFWFFALAALSAYELVYRVLVLMSGTVRMYLLMAQANYLSRTNALKVVRRLTFGDVFVLSLLGKNLNPIVYKELITQLAQSVDREKKLEPAGTYEGDITIVV